MTTWLVRSLDDFSLASHLWYCEHNLLVNLLGF